MVTEGALPSLLRLIDSTLWSVDPFGHTGDEHMALLLGHPVVVLRAVLRLDIDPALSASDAATRAVPVRLGALAAWQDGLLGFYVGDDTSLVHPASPATPPLARPVGPGQGYLGEITSVPAFHQSFSTDLQPGQTPRSPVTHPYVAPDATIRVWPSRPVALTLLVAPHASEYFALWG